MQTGAEQTSSEQLDSRAAPVATFKLILVGDSGVGKSSFIHQFSTGILEELVINDRKITVHKTRFPANIGDIQFNVWDIDGASVETEPPEEFFAGADCAILMFDTTYRVSYKNIPFWYKKIQTVHEHQTIPVALVGNKVDLKDRKVKPKQITFHRKKNLIYNDVSARANYNIEKPFIHLAKTLTKEMNLSLVESPVVQPPSTMMDIDQVKIWEAEFQTAMMPLPEDDDDF